ncbi:sarcosine oxidase subunit gamma family protein [Mesobacterium sp. TK19101]|uniref:Sarcosine oxidase subunit gamma family protein n=1 Tax=Mesobacterium hydrothermale TaxID=3111907 RepID=A0ABU6HPI7_9RHOB|nr:sarcosine oxidase subunit gamma family protein [Mesobacterium sp. TK19101]MEC3863378.1 sarcosine oxidase subunit gamma family protein [Mesobacterium sp. TK19101]
MSEAVSALNGARYEGIAQIADAGPVGMITLRGTFEDEAFGDTLSIVAGLALPGERRLSANGDRSLLWMSPDELLLICSYYEAPRLTEQLAEALADTHALVLNVSDARAMFTLTGVLSREVLAKLSPTDVAPDAFAEGDVRRTHLGQVAAGFWMEADGTIRIVCFRSVAQYMFDLLCTVAVPGSEVGYF